MVDIAPGKILIADPFLRDPNFIRSVVFICDHKDEGSFGLLLNKQHEQVLGELISNLEDCTIPVY
jgi:putative transcriptional regulator